MAYSPPWKAWRQKTTARSRWRKVNWLMAAAGELARTGQMRAQGSGVNTKDLHEAAEIIDGIDHVWVLLDDVGEKLRVDERDWELLV